MNKKLVTNNSRSKIEKSIKNQIKYSTLFNEQINSNSTQIKSLIDQNKELMKKNTKYR